VRYYDKQKQVAIMPCNDQAAFALVIADANTLPFTLPFNWNFRPRWHRSWWGPIKIWHDYADPPPDLVPLSRAQSEPGCIIQYAWLNS
jgi:hypothetical protein